MNDMTKAEKEAKELFERKAKCNNYIELDYYVVDELVSKFFIEDKDGYDCLSYEDISNDSAYEIIVSKGSVDHEEDYIQKAFEGEWKEYVLDKYLSVMADHAIIPEGTYLIKVSY